MGMPPDVITILELYWSLVNVSRMSKIWHSIILNDDGRDLGKLCVCWEVLPR